MLTSLTLTGDEQLHLLAGDGNGSNVHVCQVRGRLKVRPTRIPGTNCSYMIEGSSYPVAKNTHYSGGRNGSRKRKPKTSKLRYCRSLHFVSNVNGICRLLCAKILRIPKHCLYLTLLIKQ